MLDKYFEYKKHKTDFQTEVIAGTTTFLTMAYIMFLNPLILSDGGFDFGGVFTATILSIASCLFHNGLLRKNLADRLGARNGPKRICCVWGLLWV